MDEGEEEEADDEKKMHWKWENEWANNGAKETTQNAHRKITVAL